MKTLVMKVPDDLAESIRLTQEEFASHIRLMAALKMFELGRLSSGKAAELAGISRLEFFDECSRYHVSIMNDSPDEWEAELRSDMETIRNLIEERGDEIEIKPATTAPRRAESTPTLDTLLAGVTEQNLHAEVTTGGPVGGEAW